MADPAQPELAGLTLPQLADPLVTQLPEPTETQLPPLMRAGDAWLTADEQRRATSIAMRRLLFSGMHREYFLPLNITQHAFKAIGPQMQRLMYLSHNLPGLCTLKHADLLVGEPVSIEPKDGDAAVAVAIERISAASKLQPLLYQTVATAGWADQSYIQAIVENGNVRLETVEPEAVMPVRAPGSTRMSGATLKYQIDIGTRTYGRVIEHSGGQIRHELYLLTKDGRVESRADLALIAPGLQPVQATGIDELAIVEVVNYTPGGIGSSDYDGADSLMDEVNNRMTQISRILDEHGDPAVIALESLFDERGELKISGRAIKADSMKDGDPIKYVTWDAKLEYCVGQLDRAVKAYLSHMEIAPNLIGYSSSATSADTWKKYKLETTTTLARVNRKKLFLTPEVQTAFRVAMKLENRFSPVPAYPVAPIKQTYSDGLPTDALELQQVVCGYHMEGVMSDEMALTWIHGDPAIVQQELERIEAQKEASLPTAFRGGGMSQAEETPFTTEAQSTRS